MENNQSDFLKRCANFLMYRGSTEEETQKQRKILSMVAYFSTACGFAQGLVAVSDGRSIDLFGFITSTPLIILVASLLNSLISVVLWGYIIKFILGSLTDYEKRQEQMEHDKPKLNKIAIYMTELKKMEDMNVEIFTRRQKEEEVLKEVFSIIDSLEVKSMHEPLKELIKKKYPHSTQKILDK